MSTITSEPRSTVAAKQFTSHLHPTPSWFLADHTVPTGREETWRFTPVDRFKVVMGESASDQIAWRISQWGVRSIRRAASLRRSRVASSSLTPRVVVAMSLPS